MYIIIDILGGIEYAQIRTDWEGNNQVFKTKKEAQLFIGEKDNSIIVKIKDDGKL